MKKQSNSPFLIDDAGKKIVGVQNPDDSVSYFNDVAGSSNVTSRNRLKTLVIGNSMVTQGIVGGTSSAPQLIGRSESHIVNFLSGGVLEFPETSAIVQATYVGHAGISRDSHYSYSGATSTFIASDIDTYLIPALLASKNVYDLLLIPALFDNDISASIPTATSIANAKNIIARIKSLFPGIITVIGTSRPSSFFDTAPEKALFTATKSAVLALDNGYDIRSYYQGYDYASADGTSPVIIGVTGTISGTTMTITSVDSNPTGIPLQIGMQVVDVNHIITSVPDFNGGIGVYGVTTGLTVSGSFSIAPYTDTDGAGAGGIHTNGFGTSLNARKLAAVIKKLGGGGVSTDDMIVGNSLGMSGSTAVNSTTNVTGTMPPNITFAGNANSTLVAEALNPGLRLTYSAIADSATLQDLAYPGFDQYTLPHPVDGYRMIVKAKVISGGQYIGRIDPNHRHTDNGVLQATSAWFSDGSSAVSGPTGITYVDGDEFTFISPIIRSLGVGTLITAIRSYIHVRAKAKTPLDAVIIVDILDMGYELINDGAEIATLVAGTVTIADARVRTGSKIRFWRVINGGTVGALKETARVSGTSVTIGSFDAAGSANAADTSQIRYVIE